ncbi:MAG: L-threonylcarbamoyladenylate synthase [Bacteroidales bacterium]|nr:L-threonylcarbamoyladenylate synthase [Bacteroidales bacterium]
MEQIINETVEALRQGKTILYPTDTIWGIGCDTRNAEAVERLYTIKERDRSKSMLVLVRSAECGVMSSLLYKLKPQNSELRTPNSEPTRPTTYILPREIWEPVLGDSIAPNLPADDGTLGIRIPNHRFCQEVIARLGAPLVSTSANLSGQPSPATYNDISSELRQRVDYCVPPLPELLSSETNGSRIVKLAADGTLTVIRP